MINREAAGFGFRVRCDTAIGECQHFEEYETAKTSTNTVNTFTVSLLSLFEVEGNAETK